MPTVVGFVESGCPFPVGFGGFFQTDPNTIYAGTKWEQKKDVFILASGDTYAAGSTGGEAQHKLTVEEMPSHTHAWKGNNIGSAGSGGKNYKYPIEGVDLWDPPILPTGGSQPHNNMPPYFAMPFWVRTA